MVLNDSILAPQSFFCQRMLYDKKIPAKFFTGKKFLVKRLEAVSDRLNFFAIVIAELMFDLFERLAHAFGDAQADKKINLSPATSGTKERF